ncbi:hypothetical protein KBB12_01770 [Candidatus Woesebacteria bacterium]|nr:hypothetical protein [Candidatus Woesebacteria bacterium]
MGRFDTLRGEGQSSTRTPEKPRYRPALEDSTPVTATPLETGGRGVQHGDQEARAVVGVTHGARDANKQPEGPLEPERIPNTMSAPVRALAERVLAPGQVWYGTAAALSSDMREAIKVLGIAEQRATTRGISLPEVVNVAGKDIPVWDYIGQCVDAIGAGTIHDISSTLDVLSANPQLAPLVPRIVALHVAQVFLSHPDIKEASKNVLGTPLMRVEYYEQSHPIFISKLKAVAEYVKSHPDAGVLVSAFFGHQTPLLSSQGPALPILEYCGII